MMNTIFLLAIIAGIGFWWMYQFKKRNDLYKNIPGPRGFPILGNSIQLKSTAKLLNILLYYSKQCGGIVKFQVGPIRRFIVVSDYKLLEFILSSTKLVNKSADYKFFHPWLGTGLLTSDGPKWKKHRRILTPGFHFLILGQFIEVFERCGNKLVEKLEKEVSKDSVNIYPFITLCALDIICESIMGTNIDAQNDENSVYVRSVKDMCRIVIQRTVSPLQMFDLLFPFTKNYYTQRKALSILHTHTNNVITRRRQEMENTKREEVSKQKNRLTENKKVFLDLLLQSTVDGRKLSQQEIREEVDTFMFEGHDTIGSAVSFSLFCLANYPDVQ
ncbi:p450 domain containing protein, partial [Asbolus verrucosus]